MRYFGCIQIRPTVDIFLMFYVHVNSWFNDSLCKCCEIRSTFCTRSVWGNVRKGVVVVQTLGIVRYINTLYKDGLMNLLMTLSSAVM